VFCGLLYLPARRVKNHMEGRSSLFEDENNRRDLRFPKRPIFFSKKTKNGCFKMARFSKSHKLNPCRLSYQLVGRLIFAKKWLSVAKVRVKKTYILIFETKLRYAHSIFTIG
jgi:hypothetical protein